MNKIEYGTEFLDQLKDKVHEQHDEIQKLKEDVEYYKSSRNELISSNRKLREEKIKLKDIIKKARKTLVEWTIFETSACTDRIISETLDILKEGEKE